MIGRLARWVRAGVDSLRRLKDMPMIWQGGFAALQSMIQGWLSGSQGAALAIASLLIINACYSQAATEVWRWAGPLFNVSCVGG